MIIKDQNSVIQIHRFHQENQKMSCQMYHLRLTNTGHNAKNVDNLNLLS